MGQPNLGDHSVFWVCRASFAGKRTQGPGNSFPIAVGAVMAIRDTWPGEEAKAVDFQTQLHDQLTDQQYQKVIALLRHMHNAYESRIADMQARFVEAFGTPAPTIQPMETWVQAELFGVIE